MSILNVNTIQPIGSGTTVTVAATELKTSNFITVGTGASVTSPSANVLTLGTNTAERFRITSAGSIGIGTDNPGTKLDVRGGNWSNGDIVVGQSGNAGRIKFRRGADGSDSGSIGFSAADNNSVLSMNVASGDGTLTFQTNSTERLRITSGGNVGIGSAIPANVLDVQGTTHTKIHVGTTGTGHATGIQINHAKGNAALQEWQLQTDASADGNLKIRNATSSTDVMFFDADNNNIGINDTSPDANLSVGGSTAFIDVGAAGGNRGKIGYSSNNLYFGTSSSSGEFIFKNNCNSNENPVTAGTERFRIDSAGRVTKPTQPLAIIGTTQNNWSPSVGDTLPFNYSNTNRGNHYNTSNYTFTCPVAGDYMVIFRHSRKGWTGDVELAKNNSQYVRLELRETGRNNSDAADWQAWCYDFIIPCAANDTLKFKAASVTTGTGSGNYLLDGYNHIYYDSVTYYLIG